MDFRIEMVFKNYKANGSAGKMRGNILISGASTGIGYSVACLMAACGYRVFAGVRQSADAERLQTLSPNIQPLMLDITDAKSVEAAIEGLKAQLGEREGLHGLVNNAGICVAGPLEMVSIAALREQLEINVIGHVAVTQAVLPLLRKARGRIVNISSVAGLVAFPFMGPYCASKFALEALTDILRVELQPWGIRVASVQPGPIDTPLWEKNLTMSQGRLQDSDLQVQALYAQGLAFARKSAQASAANAIDSQAVAQAVRHALSAAHPKAHYLLGRHAWRYRLLRLLPTAIRTALFRWRVNQA